MVPERAVFLDRDGVLNATVGGGPGSPRSETEFHLIPQAPDVCARLREAGFRLVVTTNQPEIARGLLDPEALTGMHERLRSSLGVGEVRVCTHDDGDGCGCRKPRPGLILDAARELDIDLAASFVVGDRWRDVEAGRRAGCTTILIDRPWSEAERSRPDHSVASLGEALDVILHDPRPAAEPAAG
jgi:D-glycero-D-manno-heptose 1,7-bisphosphate phosphatase